MDEAAMVEPVMAALASPGPVAVATQLPAAALRIVTPALDVTTSVTPAHKLSCHTVNSPPPRFDVEIPGHYRSHSSMAPQVWSKVCQRVVGEKTA